MNVGMTIVSKFVRDKCSSDVRFKIDPDGGNLTGAMRCLFDVKHKTGMGPGPLAEQLEMVDSLPEDERVAAAAELIGAMKLAMEDEWSG